MTEAFGASSMEVDKVFTEFDVLLPPKPSEPLDSECCGTGCTPCVFDIYKKQLKIWEKECQETKRNGYSSRFSGKDEYYSFLTPEKYISLQVIQIHEETECCKIFTFTWKHSQLNLPILKDTDFPIKIGEHVLIQTKQNDISNQDDISRKSKYSTDVLSSTENTLKTSENVPRQYTILRVNVEEHTFDILIKIYPDGCLTPYLEKLRVEDWLEMRGPFGKQFSYKSNSKKHILMLSAGTGIAPMIRIIQEILNNEEDDTKIKLLFACKSLKEILLVKQLKEWESFWNFDVCYYLSAFAGENEKQVERTGLPFKLPYYGMKVFFNKRINFDELKDQLEQSKCDLIKTLFLICGTKSFEKDVINHLQKLKIVESNILVF